MRSISLDQVLARLTDREEWPHGGYWWAKADCMGIKGMARVYMDLVIWASDQGHHAVGETPDPWFICEILPEEMAHVAISYRGKTLIFGEGHIFRGGLTFQAKEGGTTFMRYVQFRDKDVERDKHAK